MSNNVEVVIVPWIHLLSEEHSKALQIISGLEPGSVLAIEQTPERVLSGAYEQQLKSFLARFPLFTANPRQILEGMRASALLQVLLLAKSKRLNLLGIDSSQLNLRQRKIMAKGNQGIAEVNDLLKIELDREKYFVEQIDSLLKKHIRVNVIVGANHSEPIAAAFREKGISCSVADTLNKDTQDYCNYRNSLKKKLAGGQNPSIEEHNVLSNWILRRMQGWYSNFNAKTELHDNIRLYGLKELNRGKQNKGSKFTKPKVKRSKRGKH